jgi:hypothetical protein
MMACIVDDIQLVDIFCGGCCVRTAATLPEAEIAPTVRLDCRRAFLNMMTRMCVLKKGRRIQLQVAIDGRGDWDRGIVLMARTFLTSSMLEMEDEKSSDCASVFNT